MIKDTKYGRGHWEKTTSEFDEVCEKYLKDNNIKEKAEKAREFLKKLENTMCEIKEKSNK